MTPLIRMIDIPCEPPTSILAERERFAKLVASEMRARRAARRALWVHGAKRIVRRIQHSVRAVLHRTPNPRCDEA